MSPKVTVQNLKKRYGAIEAARGVSFEVREGEIFGLIGPNGAGKTTTVECLVGLREPDEGTIEICGIDARRRPRDVKEKIGAALQTTALQDKITPREALALFGAFYRQKAEPAALLERFALLEKADAPFDTLSGGQRQRLALALAFVNTPELVFLDEPTAGLDPHSRRELHGEIAKMKDEGHTVLLTTHYLNEAEALCDRIAVIDRGRIVATGTPRELVARSKAMPTVVLATVQALEDGWLKSIPGVEGVSCDGTSTTFQSANVRATLAQVMKLLEARNIEIAELHVSKATLEDVFLELTAESSQLSAVSSQLEL
jgi:ABC-2 type transport system ATP-binding protein